MIINHCQHIYTFISIQCILIWLNTTVSTVHTDELYRCDACIDLTHYKIAYVHCVQ